MAYWGRRAAAFALVSLGGACITGHLLLSTTCTGSGTSCACTTTTDIGDGAACPSSSAGTLCCADVADSSYPSLGASCSCSPVAAPTAECGLLDGNCECADSVDGSNGAECPAPVAPNVCCFDGFGQTCTCFADGTTTCPSGEPVSTCTAADIVKAIAAQACGIGVRVASCSLPAEGIAPSLTAAP